MIREMMSRWMSVEVKRRVERKKSRVDEKKFVEELRRIVDEREVVKVRIEGLLTEEEKLDILRQVEQLKGDD